MPAPLPPAPPSPPSSPLEEHRDEDDAGEQRDARSWPPPPTMEEVEKLLLLLWAADMRGETGGVEDPVPLLATPPSSAEASAVADDAVNAVGV